MFTWKTNTALVAAVAAAGLGITAPQAVAAPDAPLATFGVPGPQYPEIPDPRNSTVPGEAADTAAVETPATPVVEPRATPPGANDWDCVPTAEHPRPVVLVHGTWGNAYDVWEDMAPELAADGYCVFALNYGEADLLTKGGVRTLDPATSFATKDITESSVELDTYVDAVLAATGADTVDLVGHSQGGLLVRYWLKFDGGAAKATKVVTLGATNHGTTMGGLGTLNRRIGAAGVDLDPALDYIVGEAGVQQIYGSPLVTAVNEGGDTVPGIDYTVIGTRYDTTSTPYEATFLTAGPGATVDNITLQDGCEIDRSPHGMTGSPRAIDLVRNALTPGSVPEPRCVAVEGTVE